ncbi:hypothetical protein ElyMa_001781400 [Elysia marginata]|uniref:Uncharacterized protein n=1 Tax=Elysia marginata TaxID=1093978 RepID=A0AAV4EEH9_9GAST|nr:hypothetical protein ElyMa_001781400 [Elysia marginata]
MLFPSGLKCPNWTGLYSFVYANSATWRVNGFDVDIRLSKLSRPKLDPHIKVIGFPENVRAAKSKILPVLDTKIPLQVKSFGSVELCGLFIVCSTSFHLGYTRQLSIIYRDRNDIRWAWRKGKLMVLDPCGHLWSLHLSGIGHVTATCVPWPAR